MPSPSGKVQFQLIQALRGIAAMWVVLFHVYRGDSVSHFIPLLPEPLTVLLFEYGSAGVAIFFVLSGFVISHSVANKPMHGPDLGRFVIRRSLRLDPPYWAAIAFSIVVGVAIGYVRGESYAFPTTNTLLWHVAYLQEFARTPEINIVFWTLTYEVQFYLVLALSAWAATLLTDRGMSGARASVVCMVPLALIAFVAAWFDADWTVHGLFANLWHAFFLGMLAYDAVYRRRSPLLLAALAIVTLIGAAGHERVFGVPAAIAALGLFLAGRTGYLITGLRSGIFRGLGRISYSLYLLHVPLITLVFGAWGRLAGRGPLQDALGLLIGLAGVIAASAAFWWCVERPSHELAVKLFRRPGKTKPESAPLAPGRRRRA
jgi:peptidoglycan/LPS O-acetylase OafA/YrhL